MTSRSHFFLLLALLGMTGGLGQWWMYRRGLAFLQPKWTLAFFLLLPLIFILPYLFSDMLPRSVTKTFAWIGGYWLIFFYYSVLLLLLYAAFYALCLLLQQHSLWQLAAGKLACAGFFLIWTAIAWGNWNAFHPVYREVAVVTEKPLPRELTVAFASDIHLGAILGSDYSETLARRLQAAQPDLILLGGDLIDGDLPFVMRDGSYENLAKFHAPLGVFAVYGNHDYLGADLPAQAKLFGNIRFLQDETIRIADGLTLTGLDDYIYGKKTQPPQTTAQEAAFHILLDHEPWRILAASEAGYDLYLAGHTHAGQFFPNRLATKKLYALDYGSKHFGDMLAVVSNGYGFWGAPVRIGPPPEIVLLRLQNK